MNVGDKIVIKAEKMVAGGDCMGRANGKTVFIPYAIPGETYEAEITKSFRDYDNAKITKIIEKSNHRVEPFCKLYGICGGCNMQHIDTEMQVELRKQILRDAFTREGIDCPEIEVIGGTEKGYRARIQLTDGGFSEKSSNKIVTLDECPVATAEINRYLKETPQEERPNGRVHVFGDARVQNDNHLLIANERAKNDMSIKITGAGERRKSKVKAKKNVHFKGSMLAGENKCSVILKDKKIDFDVQGFFQSNLEVLEKTIEKMRMNIGGTNMLDMYSGCGTFSLFLSDFFKKTTLVEHNRDALVFAETNLVGTTHESYGQSGEKWVETNADAFMKRNGQFDAVIIDPPRQGMEKAVCKWLCDTKIGQIRSVSCNASTHARDAAMLVKAGYTLEKLYLLDFYPQTAHTESLAFFGYLGD
ncbi:MAG: class I SAM-dependent RNA methyltransferase [Treponema sp.]|nr:class I SAM-dependent RNA methyltransferase [Treponema sp.]